MRQLILKYFFALLFLMIAAYAEEEDATLSLYRSTQSSLGKSKSPCSISALRTNYDYILEPRVAYLYPEGSLFRSVYSGGIVWGLEFDARIAHWVYGWIGAEYLHKKGTTSQNHSVWLTYAPLSVGAKVIIPWGRFQPYLGMGGQFSYFKENTSAKNLLSSVHQWYFGVRFKTGLLFLLRTNFFIDFYADYFLRCSQLYNPSHHHESLAVESTNVNVLYLGGGFGFTL